MTWKTIRKNATRKIERILSSTTRCTMHRDYTGFVPEPAMLDQVRSRIESGRGTLYETGPGSYTFWVHGGLWFELSAGAQ